MRTSSITRRLTLTVLVLECVAALTLVMLVLNHERRIQFETLDANLRATSNAILGAVQEANTADGSVRLDLDGLRFPKHAVYRVTTDRGQLLGEHGSIPVFPIEPGTIKHSFAMGLPYHIYALQGERIIDPGTTRAVNHHVTVLYGLPDEHSWHELSEATRYFAVATVMLLGFTALLMTWVIRRFLSPIHELAMEAEKIDTAHWVFHAPISSKQTVELAPLASAMEKTIARLHQTFEQQRRFTSDAAHELKTDLAIVKSSFQLLNLKQRTVEEYETGLAIGLTDIGRLENTVLKMLTLARLEQAQTPTGETCDLVQVLRDAVEKSKPFAELKDVEIHFKSLRTEISVALPEEEGYLLCSNILMNALQHSPNNSQVQIDIAQRGEEVELRFVDQGPGIAELDLLHLFEPFYRGDASRSRASGGTGLGLSICKAICDSAGGNIAISNQRAGGTEVRVTLPHAYAPAV